MQIFQAASTVKASDAIGKNGLLILKKLPWLKSTNQ